MKLNNVSYKHSEVAFLNPKSIFHKPKCNFSNFSCSLEHLSNHVRIESSIMGKEAFPQIIQTELSQNTLSGISNYLQMFLKIGVLQKFQFSQESICTGIYFKINCRLEAVRFFIEHHFLSFILTTLYFNECLLRAIYHEQCIFITYDSVERERRNFQQLIKIN